ncbi:ThuA domain-containing protein [Paenibacillus sp. NPDC058174]|uniref:ThuA domain-containing protein n=1 Tax=Paenibacillus sp. NPDC058174 TaxID=3346366 RepID=UPI0036DE1186
MYKIAAVIGDYYHREDAIKSALMSALQVTFGGKAAVDVWITDALELPQTLAKRPDAVVLFKENRVDPEGDREALWMNEAIAQSITAYVKQGGGWLAWHSGLASYPEDGAYVEMLRGSFASHPELHELVEYEGNGVQFAIKDEHYFVHCDEDRTEVYLRSSSVDGTSIAAWRHYYGEGRVCALTPAHRPEGLQHPSFIRLLGEALAWCSGAAEQANYKEV